MFCLGFNEMLLKNMNNGTGNPSPTGRNHHASVVGDGFPVPVSCFILLM